MRRLHLRPHTLPCSQRAPPPGPSSRSHVSWTEQRADGRLAAREASASTRRPGHGRSYSVYQQNSTLKPAVSMEYYTALLGSRREKFLILLRAGRNVGEFVRAPNELRTRHSALRTALHFNPTIDTHHHRATAVSTFYI
eukprot:5663715-Prymnesium_polylepis.1